MGVFWSTKSALFFMPGWLGFVAGEDDVVDVDAIVVVTVADRVDHDSHKGSGD